MYWKERAGIACSTLRERNSAAFMIPCQTLANRCCDCSTLLGRPTALSNLPTGWLDNSRKTPGAYIRNVGYNDGRGLVVEGRIFTRREVRLGDEDVTVSATEIR